MAVASDNPASSIRPDYRRVVEVVRKILTENAVAEPPVSPRDIAEAYGISVAEVFFNPTHRDVAGFFDFSERKIYVNADDPYNRKTFTIAHEMGHFFLHEPYFREHPGAYQVLLRRPIGSANDPLEKEANAFAGNLLVPRQLLDKYYKVATVSELADIFAVSADVIRNRLQLEYGHRG